MNGKPSGWYRNGTETTRPCQENVYQTCHRMIHNPYSIYKTMSYKSSLTEKYAVVRLGFGGIARLTPSLAVRKVAPALSGLSFQR